MSLLPTCPAWPRRQAETAKLSKFGVGPRFALLFGAQFAAGGMLLPFLPAVLAERGLGPREIALVLAIGALARLVAGPLLAGGGARLGARRLVAAGALAGAVAALGYPWVAGVTAALAVHATHSLAMAPVVPLSDALALAAARRGAFDYGPVRSAGSVTFVLGALLAGVLADGFGAAAIIYPAAACLGLTAAAAVWLPRAESMTGRRGPLLAPLREGAFRRLLPVAALVQGSHALYYGFATLHWQAAGLSPTVIGLLWAEGVVAEVALFLAARRVVDRLGARGLALAAAGLGVLRWGVTAETTALWALAGVQVLHAATFGAMHLASMRVLTGLPGAQAAAAQTLHASLGPGAASLLLTLASGSLYAWYGGGAFWAMAGLCGAAVMLAWRLGR